MNADIGMILAVLLGLVAFATMLVQKLISARPRPAPPQKPADPETEARAIKQADKVIDEAAAEVESIDDTEDDADRVRLSGSRLRR